MQACKQHGVLMGKNVGNAVDMQVQKYVTRQAMNETTRQANNYVIRIRLATMHAAR